MGQMTFDQALEGLKRRCLLQVRVIHDLIDHNRAVIEQHLNEVVTRATEAIQRGLAHASGFGDVFKRPCRVIDHGNRQGLQQFLVRCG
ncbi:hypothetical protein D9M71_835660 [compost metagenome]